MHTNCRSCNNLITQVFSLGDMPLVNNFIKKEELLSEKKFDLSIGFCAKCYLVQLMKTVSPEELFRHYLYFSSTSSSFLEYCKNEAEYLVKRLKLTPEDLVFEIASNDGVLLRHFKELGIKILGVDPAENIARVANKAGIRTLPEFFNNDLARRLRKEQGLEAKLVFGANILAHVPEIRDFTAGVKTILSCEGTAVFEFPYVQGLMENKFDTIYHEHVFYYSLLALKNLFSSAGLEIYDVEKTPVQGGSLRIFISHPGKFAVSRNVAELTRFELENGYDKVFVYQNINKNVGKLKSELVSLLEDVRKTGKTVAAYGAAAKGTVLMNYFGIGRYVDFVADKAEAKQGLYMPGIHLLVNHPEKINEKKPDFLLILPWNISNEIMEQFSDYHQKGGKFIIPVPSIKII